jgi:hypothetical protein
MSKHILTPQEVTEAFMNIMLEENYNFLQEDLVNLANAFVAAAKPKIVKEERDECIKFVRSLNSFVAAKLKEYRNAK